MVAEGKQKSGFAGIGWPVSLLALLLLLVVGGILLVPLVVSEERLGARLRAELEAMTGHEVDFDPRIEVSFLPVPGIRVTGLTVESSSEVNELLLSAETFAADFGLASVLVGRAQFSNFELDQPLLRIEIRRDGSTNWSSQEGHVAESAAIAADNARPALEGEEAPQEQSLPMTPLGTVDLHDGTLVIVDHIHHREETVSAVSGSFLWPRVGMGARLEVAGVLRGEPVQFLASAERPSDLIAGNTAPLRLNFSSELLTLDLLGEATFGARPAFTGSLELSSPSVRRALQWSGTEIKPGEAISALSLEAEVESGPDQITLSDVILDIDSNRGIGVLALSWPEGGRPLVAGTLAYNELDVGAFLRAFAPVPLDGGQLTPSIDTGFLRQLGLDLRFSAQSASIGRLQLQNLAAAARIERGRALFDIGDATAYGGTVLGRILISENGFEGGGEIQLTAENVDFAAAYEAVGVTGPLPRGRGSFNLTVTSPNPVWATTVRDLHGNLDMSIGEGVIPGFNLQHFRELANQERFFSVSRVSDGEVPFRSARFRASFDNGTAEIELAELLTGNTTITLSGLIPFDRGSLAMSGAIMDRPAEAAAEAPPPLRFFVGGSWPSPVISPVLGN